MTILAESAIRPPRRWLRPGWLRRRIVVGAKYRRHPQPVGRAGSRTAHDLAGDHPSRRIPPQCSTSEPSAAADVGSRTVLGGEVVGDRVEDATDGGEVRVARECDEVLAHARDVGVRGLGEPRETDVGEVRDHPAAVGRVVAALSIPYLAGTEPSRMEEIRQAAIESARAMSEAMPD